MKYTGKLIINITMWLILCATLLLITVIIIDGIRPTTLMSQNVEFKGINSDSRKTKNIVIIHGIGDHCMGYSEKLISALTDKKDTAKKLQSQAYFDFLKNDRIVSYKEGDVPLVSKYYAPIDSECTVDKSDNKTLSLLSEIADKKGDSEVVDSYQNKEVETIVRVQEQQCKAIHKKFRNDQSKSAKIKVDCHMLTVDNKFDTGSYSGNYISGFIRTIYYSPNNAPKRKIHEVIWNPATRWIKEYLYEQEFVTNKNKRYYLNRTIKSSVIDASFADAIAYLSDSGILVNYDILQSLCLVISDPQLLYKSKSVEFSCNTKHLLSMRENFEKENELFFITHSLGTRVLFDTLGLLSFGSSEHYQDSNTTCKDNNAVKISFSNKDCSITSKKPKNLLEIMAEKFDSIGAKSNFNTDYGTSGGDHEFARILPDKIKNIIPSIKSIFVFTNQIPLLSANISTPFKPREFDVSTGFQNFIKTRAFRDPDNKIQIVSFHDPDDVLSYNLKCWFTSSIIKNNEKAKELINQEAILRVTNGSNTPNGKKEYVDYKDYNEAVANERFELRRELYNLCSEATGNSTNSGYPNADRELFDKIWSSQKDLNLVDASVRLRKLSFPGLFTNPIGVHSGYFKDSSIQKMIENGN